ncbi:MAG: glutaminyl-peptide cyclotransferase [bacterium]
MTVQVIGKHPHDRQAFTQGLVIQDGAMFESTGLYGRSTVRQVDPNTGGVINQVSLQPDLFGEGLAATGNRLVQLTWREGTAIVYDIATLRETARHHYKGEGWGLCHDGKRFIMSDGSAVLQFRDTQTFDVTGTLTATLRGTPLSGLNELEYAGNCLYANIWGDDRIVRIDPLSGAVTAEIDASGLLQPNERTQADVLNGIACDPSRGTFFITGKLWPAIFEVRFVNK